MDNDFNIKQNSLTEEQKRNIDYDRCSYSMSGNDLDGYQIHLGPWDGGSIFVAYCYFEEDADYIMERLSSRKGVDDSLSPELQQELDELLNSTRDLVERVAEDTKTKLIGKSDE